MSIPASSIHFNGDGTAWWVFDENGPAPQFQASRPCDTCDGCGNICWGGTPETTLPDGDCDGTGRHTFTVEVEGEWSPRMHADRSLRVSIREGMVLPIHGDAGWGERQWPGHAHVELMETQTILWRGPDDFEHITLPPDAQPGMWAVLLDIHEPGRNHDPR